MSTSSFLGGLSVVIGIIGYSLYCRGILQKGKKPHAFSWLIWSMLTGITFFAQIAGNGGPGSWVSGMSMVFCFGIFVLSFIKGERSFPIFDWIALSGAFFAIFLWIITSDPTASVLLVVLIDVMAFLPSIRKGWQHPAEESTEGFSYSAYKYIVALFALNTVSLITALYPIYAIIMNGGFALFIILRRRSVKRRS